MLLEILSPLMWLGVSLTVLAFTLFSDAFGWHAVLIFLDMLAVIFGIVAVRLVLTDWLNSRSARYGGAFFDRRQDKFGRMAFEAYFHIYRETVSPGATLAGFRILWRTWQNRALCAECGEIPP